MSFEWILPLFPEELRALLSGPSISDLMISMIAHLQWPIASADSCRIRIELSSPGWSSANAKSSVRT